MKIHTEAVRRRASNPLWSECLVRRIFFSRGRSSLNFLYVVGGTWPSGGTSDLCDSDVYFSKGVALIVGLRHPLCARRCHKNGPNHIKFGLRASHEALISLLESRLGRPSGKPSSSVEVVPQPGEKILAEGPLGHDIVKNQAEI